MLIINRNIRDFLAISHSLFDKLSHPGFALLTFTSTIHITQKLRHFCMFLIGKFGCKIALL